jgi:hypothetical protein
LYPPEISASRKIAVSGACITPASTPAMAVMMKLGVLS